MIYGKVQKQYSNNITAICTLLYMHNVIATPARFVYNSKQQQVQQQAIMPCAKKRSGHVRLGANFLHLLFIDSI